VLAGLLLAEGIARVMDPSGGEDLLFGAADGRPHGLYSFDADLGQVPTPGFQGELRSLDYRVPLSFDEHGLSGGGESDTLVIGDSFALSLQVPHEQSFHARIGALNGGVDGYSTWQATGRYRRLADDLALSRVVLIFFLGNDLHDNTWLRRNRRWPPIQEPPPMPRWRRLLFDHSAVYAWIRVAQHRKRSAQRPNPQWLNELRLFHQEGPLERELEPTREALLELKAEARQQDHELVVAVAPPAFVVHRERAAGTFEMVGLDPSGARLDAPSEGVLALLQELDIDACDLQTPLVEQAGEEALYFTFDGHWNAAGHRVVGEALATCL